MSYTLGCRLQFFCFCFCFLNHNKVSQTSSPDKNSIIKWAVDILWLISLFILCEVFFCNSSSPENMPCMCVFEHATTQKLLFLGAGPWSGITFQKLWSFTVSIANAIWECVSPHPCLRIHFRTPNLLTSVSWFVSSDCSEEPCQCLCL